MSSCDSPRFQPVDFAVTAPSSVSIVVGATGFEPASKQVVPVPFGPGLVGALCLGRRSVFRNGVPPGKRVLRQLAGSRCMEPAVKLLPEPKLLPGNAMGRRN